MNLSFVKSCIAAAALLISASVNAATDTYGTLLAGSFQPADSFASLSYTNTGNVYDFTLTAFDLNTIFTDGAFIGAIAVDSDFQPTVSNVTGDTVVTVAPGGGPTGAFDFRFDLTGPMQARLT
ncbi:MAG TPA: PEP-CTERM sorting domain-containing protein, partial [Methylophilaceae bacterium]|nr:PEP-CTERM sorting domain-containing protein [Methylophilaceae bacterium]